MDGGWPEQLTFTDDRVMLGLYAHNAPDIVFGMDSGGDEQQQIFRLREGVVTGIDVDPAVMHAIGAHLPGRSPASPSRVTDAIPRISTCMSPTSTGQRAPRV